MSVLEMSHEQFKDLLDRLSPEQQETLMSMMEALLLKKERERDELMVEYMKTQAEIETIEAEIDAEIEKLELEMESKSE